MVQRGFAREITKEECYEIVKRAEEFGLVHLTVNTKKECLVICSCCPCCCVGLKGVMLTQLHKPNAAAHTSYFSSINSKVCDGCKDLESPVCIDRCPMDAISLKDNKAVVKASTCIGCGVCKHFCPVEGAITLKKRKRVLEPPEDLADLMTTLAEERTGA
jgi:NAD-dependent dihydropyrimidine dehydrogenase PreA subunit